jgi:hypothetical protein
VPETKVCTIFPFVDETVIGDTCLDSPESWKMLNVQQAVNKFWFPSNLVSTADAASPLHFTVTVRHEPG